MRCLICKRTFDPDESPAMPFCSRRCQAIDLGRWLDEKYPLAQSPKDPDEPPDVPPEDEPDE